MISTIKRSKVETINSVKKRKLGDELRNRLLKMQRREMKVVDVVYNIHRYLNYCVSALLGFLQSHFAPNPTVPIQHHPYYKLSHRYIIAKM